jgi:hypothetical protein
LTLGNRPWFGMWTWRRPERGATVRVGNCTRREVVSLTSTGTNSMTELEVLRLIQEVFEAATREHYNENGSGSHEIDPYALDQILTRRIYNLEQTQ